MADGRRADAADCAALAQGLANLLQRNDGEIVDAVQPSNLDPDAATFTVDTPLGRVCVTVTPSD